MKKLLSLLLVLVVLGGAGIVLTARDVNSQRQKVTVEEQTLAGDKAAAEGAVVHTAAQWEYKLHWDITHTLGQQPTARLEVQPDGKEPWRYWRDGFDLEVDYGNWGSLPILKNPAGMLRATQELLPQADKKGEAVEATVNLQDYCDFYPILANIDLPGTLCESEGMVNLELGEIISRDKQKVLETFRDFFRIPIEEEVLASLKVFPQDTIDGEPYYRAEVNLLEQDTTSVTELPGDKESYDVEVPAARRGSQVSLMAASDYTQDWCVFAINNRTASGKLLDTSHIPGGYGLYGFSFERVTHRDERENVSVEITRDTKTGVKADTLRMVYPLPETTQVLQLHIDERHQQLWVLTADEGVCRLSIVDLNTMQTLQEFSLDDLIPPEALQKAPLEKLFQPQVLDYGDFLVIHSAGKLRLLTRNEEDLLEERWMAELPKKLSDLLEGVTRDADPEDVRIAMDVDGEKLILCIAFDGWGSDCQYHVAVLDCRIDALDIAWQK